VQLFATQTLFTANQTGYESEASVTNTQQLRQMFLRVGYLVNKHLLSRVLDSSSVLRGKQM